MRFGLEPVTQDMVLKFLFNLKNHLLIKVRKCQALTGALPDSFCSPFHGFFVEKLYHLTTFDFRMPIRLMPAPLREYCIILALLQNIVCYLNKYSVKRYPGDLRTTNISDFR